MHLDGGLNEQNPERGIETDIAVYEDTVTFPGLNEQNPERGIETGRHEKHRGHSFLGLNEQNPERGIETSISTTELTMPARSE